MPFGRVPFGLPRLGLQADQWANPSQTFDVPFWRKSNRPGQGRRGYTQKVLARRLLRTNWVAEFGMPAAHVLIPMAGIWTRQGQATIG